MKRWMSNLLLVLVLFAGLSLLLYPTVADYWNSMHQSRAIATYTEQVQVLDTALYDSVMAEAHAYNERLLADRLRYYPDEAAMEAYNAQLDVTGTGVMGFIEIPKLNIRLPIYHGTDEAVLQIAVGHVIGSSLPVGGPSTHSVLSGHRGLPSAKLFTNLDQVAEGDTFLLHILDETLTYQVDQISVVEPEEVKALDVEEGADLCTLVTCTPYGVNSHRLLVRGRRIETIVTEVKAPLAVTANAVMVEEWVVAVCISVPLVLIWMIVMLITTRRKR